jgi:signal transduction histidine kinase
MPKKIKILHLEDSLMDSELIHSMIDSGDIGHDYFLAENEKDFNHILETENIDIILSDYSLPDYNGNEALKVAKEKYSHMPFIFVSGAMGEDRAIDAMLNGARDYVLKNKLERLIPAIKRALHEQELEIKRKQAEKKLKEKNELIEAQNEKYIQINKELVFQNEEKEKRAAELIIANKELAYQNEEKEKRAAELIIANKELLFQNEEKEQRAKEHSTLNKVLTESLNQIQNINNELIISKNKAEESDKLKSAFLANMSHEIRTPLNAIMGFSGFLTEPELSKENLEDFVQIINANSRQLLSIISDIMDFSKMEAGQFTIDSEIVNINILMTDLFVTYKKIVDLKKLNLEYFCDRPNELIQTKTDGNRIKQVICNLLNNAIKFTKEGKIEFGYKIKKNLIEFYVKDTGIGISPENHSLVFQRFRQVEAANNQINSGNGLGLSISKALVEKLGGNITLDSNLGIGSTFVFTIPYIIESYNDTASVLTSESEKYDWNEKTILLVEDEVNNHAYAEQLLKITKSNILHAWDGSEAVEMVKNHPEISLVLMDIKMPVMNGYEATKHIKQIRPELPVIAQTAYALSQEKKQALLAGCDNYISKPIDKYLFMKLLSSFLN